MATSNTELESKIEQLNQYVSTLPNDITTRIEDGWDYIHRDVGEYNKHLVMDSTPTIGSNNPVTSDGIRRALDEKASGVGGGVDGLPSQLGNNGKFLQTDGRNMYWTDVDALPPQFGNDGRFLKTNGESAEWSDIKLNLNSCLLKTGGTMSGYVDLYGDPDFHNSIWRGKNLGSSLTAQQSMNIQNGSFDDLYIGDYWLINNIIWRIVAFDYYYGTGDTACNTHHAVVVPDTYLYTATMNDTNIVTGAYVGSLMYTTNINQARTTIKSTFGNDHVLTIRQYFSNAVNGAFESAGAWVDADVWLMTEPNVYGCKHFNNILNGTSWANNYTIDNRQYPAFRMRTRITQRQTYWLRDVASATIFCCVNSYGNANAYNASNSLGVRPAFCVI